MKNCDDSVHRRRSESLRSLGPRMQIPLLFFFKFMFFLNIRSAVSSCIGPEFNTRVYPQGDIIIPYPGTPLEVYCTAVNNYTSRDILFTLNGQKVPSTIINETTIKIYVERPERQNSLFYCSNKEKPKKHCLSRVLVDTPPKEVTDFKCISRNLESLNCSWTYPQTYTFINYNLTFFVYNKPVKDCHIKSIGNMRYCVWDVSTVPIYRQLQEYYFFNLTASNVFGSLGQNFTVDHFSIVKPDKPLNLGVIKVGQHSVLLHWEIPNAIRFYINGECVHKIEYQIAKQSSFHAVDTSLLHNRNNSYIFNLTDLPYSHVQYEVRISIRTKKAKSNEFWSDYAFCIFTTDSEIPDKPPEMAPGGFVRSAYDSHRDINVYWKQLDEYKENGANFTYHVLVSQNDKNKVLFPQRNKSLSFVTIKGASTDPIHVVVHSQNIIGQSKLSSYMYIPAEIDILNGPTSFTKLAFENGTYELSWESVTYKNIDNYTLFWCQYNYTHMCVGRLDFISLDSKKTSHVIELPSEKKYQFAISVNKGTYTSGMIWAKCDISRDGVSMYGFPVQVKYGVPGKTHVVLSWSMECSLADGTITGYNISYCPIIKNTNLCDKSVNNQSVYIANPKVMKVNVTNLLPFRTYRFDLALNTTYGTKITNETAYVTTIEDVPTEPVNFKVDSISYNSMDISWDPPLKRNGNIVRYLIYNYDSELHKETVYNFTDTSRRNVTLKALHGFTNYSLSVVACNSDPDMSLCSNRSASVFVLTRIGPPSKLRAPTFDGDMLRWNTPEVPAGFVNMYQVKKVVDDKYNFTYNTTELSMFMKFCDGANSGEKFQVRAVNVGNDSYYVVYADAPNDIVPIALESKHPVFYGEWSDTSNFGCKDKDTFVMVITFIGLLLMAFGMGVGSIKLYKKYRKMEDLKAEFPKGLSLSEKDIPKFPYVSRNATNDSGKMSSSDEALLLPNKTTGQSSIIQQDITGSTDSTTISQTSQKLPERDVSTGDEHSASSLNLDNEVTKIPDDIENEEICESETDSSTNSSNVEDKPVFKKDPSSGYIQHNISPKGYVQPCPVPTITMPGKIATQPTTSSYVMAGLSPAPIFTTGVAIPHTEQISMVGYLRPEDVQPKCKAMNLPTLGQSPTKGISPESLPSLSSMTTSKCSPESSYIQLQSLEPASLKPAMNNPVPSKPASNGYISPTDAVMNKHLNILAGGHLREEHPVFDRTMSPDAYCRFSWGTDPSHDNLRAILADSNTENPPKES